MSYLKHVRLPLCLKEREEKALYIVTATGNEFLVSPPDDQTGRSLLLQWIGLLVWRFSSSEETPGTFGCCGEASASMLASWLRLAICLRL